MLVKKILQGHTTSLCNILGVMVAQGSEYLSEHLSDNLHGLVEVVHNGYLEIQPHELRQLRCRWALEFSAWNTGPIVNT